MRSQNLGICFQNLGIWSQNLDTGSRYVISESVVLSYTCIIHSYCMVHTYSDTTTGNLCNSRSWRWSRPGPPSWPSAALLRRGRGCWRCGSGGSGRGGGRKKRGGAWQGKRGRSSRPAWRGQNWCEQIRQTAKKINPRDVRVASNSGLPRSFFSQLWKKSHFPWLRKKLYGKPGFETNVRDLIHIQCSNKNPAVIH